MANRWLDVPLQDYEGHMSSPEVAQLAALADIFEEALWRCHPESVTVLGIAGGNGLDRIDSSVTNQIRGFDINPSYLEAARERYPHLPLSLLCVDLETTLVEDATSELVHAALIFEHAGTGACLQNAVSLVSPRGHLSVVLQLPSSEQAAVSPSHYASIQALGERFALVEPAKLEEALAATGFALWHHKTHALPAAKALWHGIFLRPVSP